MIHIYTTTIDSTKTENFAILEKLLSPRDQAKAARFIHAPDQHRLIAGRLSLQFALADMEISPTTDTLLYTGYGRPSLGAGVDFNISHAGKLAVCAISRTQTVGIDIEEVRNITLEDFTSCFSPAEWSSILARDPLRRFYTFWTMKEAAIKANGMGLSIPLSDVNIVSDTQVIVQSQTWHVTSINIHPGYIGHVASREASTAIRITSFALDSFL